MKRFIFMLLTAFIAVQAIANGPQDGLTMKKVLPDRAQLGTKLNVKQMPRELAHKMRSRSSSVSGCWGGFCLFFHIKSSPFKNKCSICLLYIKEIEKASPLCKKSATTATDMLLFRFCLTLMVHSYLDVRYCEKLVLSLSTFY